MSRNPEWNVNRNFSRAEVYFVTLPSEPPLPPDPSFVLEGDHRAIVLFDSDFPRNTVTVLPISSLYDGNGHRKETIATDYILNANEYTVAGFPFSGTIQRDSFVKMEQIRSISRHYLERKVGEILPEDMLLIDLRLIASLSLQDTVSKLVEAEVEKRLQDMASSEDAN